MEATATAVFEGRVSFEALVEKEDWGRLAGDLLNRWPAPGWVDKEDVVQELLIGAYEKIWEFQPDRGVKIGRYVVWNAVDKAKKKIHKWRGAKLHGSSDRNRSRFEKTSRIRDNALERMPSTEECLEKRAIRGEAIARSLESRADRMVFRAMDEGRCFQSAARQVHLDGGVLTIGDARLRVREIAEKIAGQLEAR